MHSLVAALFVFAFAIDPSSSFGLKDSRRSFLSKAAVATASISLQFAPPAALAAPEIFTTQGGIKYATIKPGTGKGSPQDRDIVAIEYTGYLTDGTIFGKSDR